MMQRRHRAARLAALAAVAALVPAASAHAAAAPIVAGAAFVKTVPFIDGTLYVFECHAVAPGASSTTISSCVLSDGLHNIAAPPSTSSGPFAETNEGVATSPTSQWHVCWTASATYAGGTTQSTSGCTTTSSIAGIG